MITYAVIVFAIAAIGGILLAARVLGGEQAPWSISILHAVLGATGLVLVIVAGIQSNWPGRVSAALALLVIAALGGFYLASKHLRGKIAPKGIVLVHAGVAVVGFLTLLTVLM